MKEKKKKVIVAMSGGVDSSVAAALLKKEGYDAIGVFMKFWKGPGQGENRCCSPESEVRARLVAKILDIPFYVFNFEKEFKKRIVDYFIKRYKEGITPNPCVVCNKEIKFGLLMEKALELGADYVATGHYAQISFLERHDDFSHREKSRSTLGLALPALAGNHGRSPSEKLSLKDIFAYKLLRGGDSTKDQSYFLWQLTQEKLKRILFPVGGMTKPEVKKLAEKFKLPFKKIPESMEICFVPDKLEDFLKKYIKVKPGPILTAEGKKIGEHQGLPFYTIGQRKGIELSGGPYYVVGKDIKKNTLIVASILKDEALWSKELVAKDVNWISGKEPKLPIKVMAQIRYRHSSVPAAIHRLKTKPAAKTKNYRLVFSRPQRAVTPGQSVVFYCASPKPAGAKAGKGNELVGGGVIC